MNTYQKKVMLTIDEKLIEYAMEHAKSLINIDMLYHHNIQEIQSLYIRPHEHYSKILKLAYDKTIQYYKKEQNII